jgi:glycosidase
VLEDYRSVLEQRQSMQVLKTGSIRLFDTADNILAFLRHSETETVFCAFNFSETGQHWLAQGVCAGLEMIEGLSQGVRMDGPALDFEGLGVCVARVQGDEGRA